MGLLWEPVRPFDRALVIVAHPDDAEFSAAGTIARWVDMGTEVSYVVVTDGASGSSDPQMTRERLARLRVEEQDAAARALGARDVTYLGFPDGFLEPSIEARRAVAAEIRRHRPEVIITIDPSQRWSDRGYINHPDHRAVGDLVLHSINPAASTRLWDLSLIDEGLEPWDVSELWLMSFGAGTVVVDVTDTYDRKLQALSCHASQLGSWDPEPYMRESDGEIGKQVGVTYGESFTVLRFRTLLPEGGTRPNWEEPADPTPEV